jgi:catechol 2,3-dioxygenase-like lactoylglutathione lyase family enzyme
MPPGGEERATAFYAGLLGLRPVPKPEPLAARGGCWFLGPPGTPALHLGIEADFRAARKAHPAFVVADLDALESALEAAGHPVVPDVAVDGRRRSFVDDPFGNRVELVEAGAG